MGSQAQAAMEKPGGNRGALLFFSGHIPVVLHSMLPLFGTCSCPVFQWERKKHNWLRSRSCLTSRSLGQSHNQSRDFSSPLLTMQMAAPSSPLLYSKRGKATGYPVQGLYVEQCWHNSMPWGCAWGTWSSGINASQQLGNHSGLLIRQCKRLTKVRGHRQQTRAGACLSHCFC